MYRLIPLPVASEPKPGRRGILAGFAAVAGLSLLGMLSLVVIGYYLPAASAKAWWFISRSSGVVAYGLLTLSVVWGLIQSGALFRTRFAPVLTLGLHSYFSWLGLGLTALHALILAGDSATQFSLPQVVIPFLATYRPLPVGLGILGFYLMLLLSLSFYARRWLGYRGFRLLHYTSFGVFVMVTLHSLLAGTDTGALWWLYTLSLVVVVGLTLMRIRK